MTDEEALAGRIRASVTTVFPEVTVDEWSEGRSRVIHFVPPNEDGASVTITVGDSVVVEAMFFSEDLAEHGSRETQATIATGIALSIADNGLAKVTQPLPQFPFRETVYGPASGYWGIDEFALSVLRPPVLALWPWSGSA